MNVHIHLWKFVLYIHVPNKLSFIDGRHCDCGFQELESERVKLMEEVTANKKKMKELEDNLLYRLTSTKVSSPLF